MGYLHTAREDISLLGMRAKFHSRRHFNRAIRNSRNLGLSTWLALSLALSVPLWLPSLDSSFFTSPGKASLTGSISAQARLKADSDGKTNAVQQSIGTIPSPEAGVKLLLGIFRRIGNEPRIAMQPPAKSINEDKQSGSDGLISSQLFQAKNTTQPELAIRPQPSSKAKAAPAIAMAAGGFAESSINEKARSSKKEIGQESSSRMEEGSASSSGTRDWSREHIMASARRTSAPKLAAPPPAGTAQSTPSGLSTESHNRLSNSLGKLYDLSSGLARVQEWRQDSDESDRSSVQEYGRSRLLRTSDSRKADESEATRMKPENPTAYKHLREYQRKTAPPSLDSLASSRGARFQYAPNTQMAYSPPSLITGVPGLTLGSSSDKARAFLEAKGRLVQNQVDEWQVWTLKAGEKESPSLQVYVRSGTVEAFRIFDSTFVPDKLGINLKSSLQDMKAKFGEPAFTLMEPEVSNLDSPRGGRNYVYPVSQISFQLTRTSADSQPTITSILLFKFL